MKSTHKDSPASAGEPGAAGHVAAIDALRAVAVLAVILYHMRASWLPGGFAGVDVFLVISGYVISRSMLTLDARDPLRFTAGFYARRARRILPALLVCLIVVCLLTTLLVPDSWLARTNHSTASYAFWGLSNYYLSHYGDPYFAPRIDFNPAAHTWSLGVEEQFYWLYPLVFFSWLRLRHRGDAARLVADWLLVLLTAASLAFSAYLSARSPAQAYYSLPSRFWELGAGALLFQLHASRTPVSSPRTLRLWGAFALIAIGLVFSRERLFPVPWALAAVLGTALAIDAAVMRGGGRPVRGLSWSLPVWTGTRSYSLYLWHWPVYALFRWTVGLESWGTRLVAICVIAGLSEASYRWVETPFRRGLRRTPALAVIAAALSCVWVLWVVAGRIDRHHEQLSLSVTREEALWYPAGWSGESVSGSCRIARIAEPFAGGERMESRRSGCPEAATHLFVTGNSHAVAYNTLLARLSAEQSYDVTIYFRSGCGLLTLDETVQTLPPECRAFYEAILRDLARRARPGDILFLPSLRLPRLSDQWVRFSDAEVRSRWRDWQRVQPAASAEAAGTLERLEALGLRVVFEAPKPLFGAPAFRCSDWFNRVNPICAGGLSMPRQRLLAYRRPVLEAMRRLAGGRVFIWDPFDTLCPRSTCVAVAGKVPLFFDADHISGYSNQLLYPGFLAFLSRLPGAGETAGGGPG
jgi:peptidoglycan/LPS O-acetylase OafA/YrhL